jgi:hypothetical protein
MMHYCSDRCDEVGIDIQDIAVRDGPSLPVK